MKIFRALREKTPAEERWESLKEKAGIHAAAPAGSEYQEFGKALQELIAEIEWEHPY